MSLAQRNGEAHGPGRNFDEPIGNLEQARVELAILLSMVRKRRQQGLPEHLDKQYERFETGLQDIQKYVITAQSQLDRTLGHGFEANNRVASMAPAGEVVDVYVPDIAGPFAWAQVHSWAQNIHDWICPVCGAFAIRMVRACHDLVNMKLGKPVRVPDDLKYIGELFAKAARGENPFVGDAHAKLHAAAETAARQVQPPDTIRKALDRALWQISGVLKTFKRFRDGTDDPVAKDYFNFMVEAVEAIEESVLQAIRQAPLNAKLPHTAGLESKSGHLHKNARSIDFTDNQPPLEELLDREQFEAFRVDVNVGDGHGRVYGCPTGKFDAQKMDCQVPGKLQAIIHPAIEEGQLEQEAFEKGIPIKANGAALEASPTAISMFLQGVLG